MKQRLHGILRNAVLMGIFVAFGAGPCQADGPQAFGPNIGIPGDPPPPGCAPVTGGYSCTFSPPPAGAAVTVTNGRGPATSTQASTFTVTMSGEGETGELSEGPASFATFGVTGASDFAADDEGTSPPPYVNGGSLTITNTWNFEADNMDTSNIYFAPPPGQTDDSPAYQSSAEGSALGGLSIGAEGFSEDSKNPDDPNFNGGAGGSVTITNSAAITAHGSGEVLVYDMTNLPVALSGIGAFSIGGNGVADKTSNVDKAGYGGDGGTITVSNTGTIAVSGGGPANGIFAVSQGGVGSNREAYAISPGGNGGVVSVTHSGTIAVSGANQMTGILATSIGGDSNDYSGFGGHNADPDASGAGNGGAVNVTLASNSNITVSDGSGIGVMAISTGGNADNVAEGSGGAVTVIIDEGAAVTNSGGQSLSMGVLAVSSGAIGDVAPFLSQNVNTAFSGSPGTVTVSNAGSVSSTGSMAVGIAALSLGGAGIVTNGNNAASTLGNVADQYSGDFSASGVTLDNSGSVTTTGAASHGLVALSAGGGGGLLSLLESGVVTAVGSQTTSSGGGNGASVSVTNSGKVETGNTSVGGDSAIGIVAQSIGGGGGSSGTQVSFIGGGDGDNSGGGNGGEVSVQTSGSSSVVTHDAGALGILAQSVGGGGGNGANAYGIFAAVGGQGGYGGNGGSVTVDVDDSGGVATAGHYAAGVVAQSVGGGGGNGGKGDAFGSFFADSIGGTGSGGGSGGELKVTNASTIATAGNQSWGLVAQSIGGGGGTGGSANSYSASIITIGLAMGGSGGSGGQGGAITVLNEGNVYTGCNGAAGCGFGGGPALDGANAVGVLAQSIGGGGGSGGSAAAKSLSLPSEDIPSLAFDFAVGGSGGSGGDGGTVGVTSAGAVYTAADASYGVLAQSIGGGGNGGDATAAAYGIEGGMPSFKIAVALGGSGGVAGSGDSVTVTNGPSADCTACASGIISTAGGNATGILAQSVGGGGGTGGAGNASASSPNVGGDTGTAIDVTTGVGGSGGGGNVGGAVTVTNTTGSSIATQGSASQGILAQSIGGGGGAAGGGSASASGDSFVANITVGGDGGSGNNGGTVTVTNDGTITTGLARFTNQAGLSITTGGDSVGILAQSIGGGGGLAGSSDPAANIDIAGQVEDALNSPSDSYEADIGIGGSGGAGGTGGTVTLTNSGSITTYGVRAFGIEAQSIGGGGGNGGAASSTSNSVLGGPTGGGNAGTYSADIAIGGSAGSGADAGNIKLTNSGTIVTAGYSAHGVLLQSIGGGGGVGAEGTVDNTSTIGLGLGFGGSSGNGGFGGLVSVTDSGSIVTAGNDAYGILAQSIGSSGGVASSGCSNPTLQANAQGVTASACLGNTGVSGSTAPWNDSTTIDITLGGQTGASGYADNVDITKTDGLILTSGDRAMGIVAQSISGGGGLVAADSANISSIEFGSGQSQVWGRDITIDFDAAAAIATSGKGAIGILAQSIGGGGGFAGDSSLDLMFVNVNTLPLASPGETNYGGDITVTLSGNVTTTGTNAHGLVVQSSGAGGGATGYGNSFWLGGPAAQEVRASAVPSILL